MELKAIYAYTYDEVETLYNRAEGNEYYLKSEVDAVIAEKDAEIAELKDKLQNVSSLLNQTREYLVESQKLHKRCADNAVKVICHQKYKRCLAMAKWCESEAYIHEHGSDYDEDLVAWFRKWHERWLKIAEEFKEAS